MSNWYDRYTDEQILAAQRNGLCWLALQEKDSLIASLLEDAYRNGATIYAIGESKDDGFGPISCPRWRNGRCYRLDPDFKRPGVRPNDKTQPWIMKIGKQDVLVCPVFRSDSMTGFGELCFQMPGPAKTTCASPIDHAAGIVGFLGCMTELEGMPDFWLGADEDRYNIAKILSMHHCPASPWEVAFVCFDLGDQK